MPGAIALDGDAAVGDTVQGEAEIFTGSGVNGRGDARNVVCGGATQGDGAAVFCDVDDVVTRNRIDGDGGCIGLDHQLARGDVSFWCAVPNGIDTDAYVVLALCQRCGYSQRPGAAAVGQPSGRAGACVSPEGEGIGLSAHRDRDGVASFQCNVRVDIGRIFFLR